MNDITSQDKPLNAYDLNAIGDYVSTLKPPSPNKSPMLEPDKEALSQALDNLQKITELEEKIKTLEAQHAIALRQAQVTHINEFNQFKADVIVSLKALELVAIASQRHGDIALNHRERDQRMEHLQTIIKNTLIDFGGRSLKIYEGDFDGIPF